MQYSSNGTISLPLPLPQGATMDVDMNGFAWSNAQGLHIPMSADAADYMLTKPMSVRGLQNPVGNVTTVNGQTTRS